eukprot:scaffold2.g6926.t1
MAPHPASPPPTANSTDSATAPITNCTAAERVTYNCDVWDDPLHSWVYIDLEGCPGNHCRALANGSVVLELCDALCQEDAKYDRAYTIATRVSIGLSCGVFAVVTIAWCYSHCLCYCFGICRGAWRGAWSDPPASRYGAYGSSPIHLPAAPQPATHAPRQAAPPRARGAAIELAGGTGSSTDAKEAQLGCTTTAEELPAQPPGAAAAGAGASALGAATDACAVWVAAGSPNSAPPTDLGALPPASASPPRRHGAGDSPSSSGASNSPPGARDSPAPPVPPRGLRILQPHELEQAAERARRANALARAAEARAAAYALVHAQPEGPPRTP